jgi:unsaturated rhamnogalacturonyl hydrolase
VTANLASITAANPSAFPRARETVALSAAELGKIAPAFELKKAVVVDAAGRPVLSQLVDMNGDDEPDELVFQADFAAGEAKRFNVRLGQRHPAAPAEHKVYGRFVRERHDDFAWENELVAHRTYGPDLETWQKDPLVSSGIDTWSKRVPKLVVNEWYMTDDYHQDVGQGADFYGVGKSRGCGGLGIWAGGKLHTSRNFTRSRVLANGPIRLVFELSYAPWDVPGGAHISETKRVVLDAGTPFNRFESTFSGGKGALSVGIGIAKHAGSALQLDAGSSAMRVWEPVKDNHGTASGNLGCAIVLNPGAPLEAQASDLDYLAVTPTDAAGRIVYRAGSTWDRAGRVRDAGAWAKTVQDLAAKLAAPLQVQIAPPATK